MEASNFFSSWQVELQPSPSVVLPSSQVSGEVILPSPQMMEIIEEVGGGSSIKVKADALPGDRTEDSEIIKRKKVALRRA